jgi:hypothetical protein
VFKLWISAIPFVTPRPAPAAGNRGAGAVSPCALDFEPFPTLFPRTRLPIPKNRSLFPSMSECILPESRS